MVINLSQDEICTYDASGPGQVIRRSGAVVAGTYSRAFIADTRQHLSMLGVHFHPGGAFPLLGPPTTELSDAHTNLEDVWGTPARILRQQMCDAVTTPERFQLMEQALLDRARRFSSGDGAVDVALRLFGPIGTGSSTSAVARELGLSQRQLFICSRAKSVSLQSYCAASSGFNTHAFWRRAKAVSSGRSVGRKSRSRADITIRRTSSGIFRTFPA